MQVFQWSDLIDAGLAIEAHSRNAGVPRLHGDSAQVAADKVVYSLAVATSDWPADVQSFWCKYRPRHEQVAAEVLQSARTELFALSVASELGAALTLQCFIGAKRWFSRWSADGRNPAKNWLGWLIGAGGRALLQLRSRLLRRDRSFIPPMLCTGCGDSLAAVEYATVRGNPPPRGLTEWQSKDIDQILNRVLQPIDQRVFRLHHADLLMPLPMTPWRFERIARRSGLRVEEVAQRYSAAALTVKNALNSSR